MVSLYDPNVPTGLVDLDTDYKNLQNNFAQADTTFGIDHYKFSNQTTNNGFHNKVTTPLIIGGVHPITATAIPIFYAMTEPQVGAVANLKIGNIQYSRGPPRALAVAPSPVTILQSLTTGINIGGGGNENLLDFTGIPRAMCKVFALCTDQFIPNFQGEWTVWWDGTNNIIQRIANGTTLQLQFAGNILRLHNAGGPLTSVFWSIQLIRVT